MSRTRVAVVALAAQLIAAALPTAAADESGAALSRLLERVAPSIVAVRARLRTTVGSPSGQEEQEGVAEARGALVGPRGLIVLWNAHLSAARWLEAFSAQAQSEHPFQVKVTPVEIRVTLPGRDHDHAAILVASDGDLDLAFLQLDPPSDAALPFVDFGEPGKAEIGLPVVTVSRLGSAFDGAPYFETARLAGRIEKPREAWLLDGLASGFGLPLFDLSGRPVGILTTVLSRVPDGPTGGGGDFTAFAPVIRQRQENARLGAFVLPADRVRGLVVEATKRAERMLAEKGIPLPGPSPAPAP